MSLVSALAPRCVAYSYSHTANDQIVTLSDGCGTSLSTPQIAGAGVLIKDWFLTNNYTSILTSGRLFTVLLAMTDRANSATTTLTSGFNQKWGGGRFQARMFDLDNFDAELGSPWGWETWGGVVSHGQVSYHEFLGSGAEPSGIAQFKAYGMFFEEDYVGLANLNLRIVDSNCLGSTLRSDNAYDVKMMAQIGSSASGKQLCVRRSGASVPSGETRLLHHFAYYSGGVSMR